MQLRHVLSLAVLARAAAYTPLAGLHRPRPALLTPTRTASSGAPVANLAYLGTATKALKFLKGDGVSRGEPVPPCQLSLLVLRCPLGHKHLSRCDAAATRSQRSLPFLFLFTSGMCFFSAPAPLITLFQSASRAATRRRRSSLRPSLPAQRP